MKGDIIHLFATVWQKTFQTPGKQILRQAMDSNLQTTFSARRRESKLPYGTLAVNSGQVF